MNVVILRAKIDTMTELYSARISGGDGGHQTILNALLLDPTLMPRPTLADVRAAMALRIVPQPERVAAGAAALRGRARVG